MILRAFIISLASLIAYSSFAQDTIVVQTFTWDSTSRAGVFTFPDNPGQSYRKILMRYNMRCHDAAVGNGNVGCYEWDYSCNTFLTDSSRVDSFAASHPDHIISNFPGTTFEYTTQPTYTYLETYQVMTSIGSIISETASIVGDSMITWSMEGGMPSGKRQFLFTAAELQAAGVSAGPVNGLSWYVASPDQALSFLTIRMKAGSATELDPANPDLDGFTEVYRSSVNLQPGEFPLYFFQPFEWDGVSNLILEYSYTTPPEWVSHNELAASDAGFAAVLYTSPADRSVRFAGETYVEAPAAAFSTISEEITVAFWSYGNPDVLPANNSVFEGLDGAGRRQVNVHLPWSNGRIYWDCGSDGAGYDRIDKAANPEDFEGTWNHWAFTKNAATGEMKIFLNGQLWHSGTGKTKAIDLQSLIIGANGVLGNRYYGKVDDFQVWNKALDAQVIADWMYRAPSAAHPDYAHLLCYYPFDEGAGNTATDASPNGYDAAIDGMATWELVRGKAAFKHFASGTVRPKTAFLQGTYQNYTSVDLPAMDSVVNNRHEVRSYGLNGTDLVQLGTDYFYPAGMMEIRNENNQVVGFVAVPAEGSIEIEQLAYFAKAPAKYELLSLVTPYGNGLDLGPAGKTFFFDMSDYAPILRGDKRLSIEMGGQNQEELDIQFWFITGTPEREVREIQQIWPFRRGWYADIQSDAVFEPREVGLRSDAAAYKLRCSVTGHGQNGEFIPRTHYIDINEGQWGFYFDAWKECSEIPIYPQGGTWLFDRAGWCPGDPTQVHEFELTDFVSPGQTITLDYGVDGAFMSEANYLVANQLVSYGPYAHGLDAAIEAIARPSKRVEFERINPACNKPLIHVKNAGSEYINSLTIDYWVEGNGTTLSHTFQGSIVPGETREIELPVPFAGFWKTEDAQIFHAELTSVNGQADEYADNDRMSSPFDLPLILDDQLDLILKIRTNNKASENYYTIKDHSGAVVASRYNMANNTTYEDDLNLPPGCYTLHFEDAGDDGLYYWFYPNNGTGYVRIQHLINGTGLSLHNFESEFGGSLKFDFVVGEITSTEEVADARVFSIFPNPVRQTATIELSGFAGGAIQVELTDPLGRRLWQDVCNIPAGFHQQEIDLEDLPAGLYFVRVRHGDKVWVKEVVKG